MTTAIPISTEKSTKTTFPSRRRGGSTTDLVFVLLVLALVGMGIWWLIKSYGKAGQQYSEALIQGKQNATDLKCHLNLRAVYQTLQVAMIGEGAYPDSIEALRRLCSDRRVLTCPDPNGGEYIYIPPERIDMGAAKILLLDPKPLHQGRCGVLLVNGQLDFLTPDEIKAMLKE